MKTLMVIGLLLVSGYGFADDAGTSFATGFANALNRQLGGNPNDSRPAPVQQVEVYQAPVVQRHDIRAIREDGTLGPLFYDYSSCRRFVRNTFGFGSCERSND